MSYAPESLPFSLKRSPAPVPGRARVQARPQRDTTSLDDAESRCGWIAFSTGSAIPRGRKQHRPYGGRSIAPEIDENGSGAIGSRKWCTMERIMVRHCADQGHGAAPPQVAGPQCKAALPLPGKPSLVRWSVVHEPVLLVRYGQQLDAAIDSEGLVLGLAPDPEDQGAVERRSPVGESGPGCPRPMYRPARTCRPWVARSAAASFTPSMAGR